MLSASSVTQLFEKNMKACDIVERRFLDQLRVKVSTVVWHFDADCHECVSDAAILTHAVSLYGFCFLIGCIDCWLSRLLRSSQITSIFDVEARKLQLKTGPDAATKQAIWNELKLLGRFAVGVVSVIRVTMNGLVCSRCRFKLAYHSTHRGCTGWSWRKTSNVGKSDSLLLSGFARTILALYVVCLLNALLKVQMSIYGRYVLQDDTDEKV